MVIFVDRLHVHGRPQNSFLGWAKGYFNTFHSQILLKLAILFLKFHKCQLPGLGKCLVLPIGGDAHVHVALIGSCGQSQVKNANSKAPKVASAGIGCEPLL